MLQSCEWPFRDAVCFDHPFCIEFCFSLCYCQATFFYIRNEAPNRGQVIPCLKSVGFAFKVNNAWYLLIALNSKPYFRGRGGRGVCSMQIADVIGWKKHILVLRWCVSPELLNLCPQVTLQDLMRLLLKASSLLNQRKCNKVESAFPW